MIYMLVINRTMMIPDENTLEIMKSKIFMESYDDETLEYSKIYNDYLDEVFKIDKELSKEVANRVSPLVIPIVSVSTDTMEQFKQLEFSIITNDDYNLSTIDARMIQDLCHERYKNVVPLMDRICSL